LAWRYRRAREEREFGRTSFFAKIRQQKKGPRQAFLARKRVAGFWLDGAVIAPRIEYVQWRDLGEMWRTGAEVDC
jgi:hypothetical protein